MQVELLNIYSNEAMPDSELIGDHGQSFLFTTENEQILMDVGANGKILLHNMKILGVDPNKIDKLILSHGHYDHTGGLPEFLDARDKPIEVIAHPAVQEKKRAKVLFIKKDLGFPKLNKEQQTKLKFMYSKESVEVIPGMITTGEIRERPERDGTEPTAQHIENNKWVIDPVWDDISVILLTKEGQVVVTGCGHAGILNILNRAKQMSSLPIQTVIGGTHMVRYTREEVITTGEKFVSEFDSPNLYLNHCTDKLPTKLLKQTPTIEILSEKLHEKINHCYVGTKLTFEI